MQYRPIKYLLDRVIAAVVLVPLSPILALLALAVRLDSPGPVLFRQTRIGERGRPFTVYKFRTMYVDAPAYSLKVRNDDPRVTPLGQILRRTALDELPQLGNILRGEMSWVGPRPEQPFIVERYEPWQRRRLDTRPGLTGWWQVTQRGFQQMHEHVEADNYYVEHCSFWLDLKILLLTPLALWRQDGRRRSPASIRQQGPGAPEPPLVGGV